MYRILSNCSNAHYLIDSYHILIQIRAFHEYLLEKLTADNLEAIHFIFKINMLLSQSIKVLGFSQSGHFYLTIDTTWASQFYS